MDALLESLTENDYVDVCVRDPRLHKDGRWHSHVDYEICLYTKSICFQKKTSYVRRRYSEFVWLRHCLGGNALPIEVPKLPPSNPFFSLKNEEQVSQRMKGMEEFLENVFQNPLFLSDSRLHLFLQSDLCIKRIERCVVGKTRYTVAEAIQRSRTDYSSSEDNGSCDSDCESSASSGMGFGTNTTALDNVVSFHHSYEEGFSN